MLVLQVVSKQLYCIYTKSEDSCLVCRLTATHLQEKEHVSSSACGDLREQLSESASGRLLSCLSMLGA